MSKFEQIGFLAEDELGVSDVLNEKYEEYIELCENLNKELCQNLYNLSIHNDDIVQLLGSGLYARFLSNSQSCLLLFRKGMKIQTNIMLRCTLETLFPLVAISKDPSFAEKFIDETGYFEQRKTLKSLIKFFEPDIFDVSNDRIKELDEIIKIKNIKKRSVQTTASAACLIDWYETLYRFTSHDVHSSLLSVEKSFVTEGDIVSQLKFEPEVDGFKEILLCLAVFQRLAFLAISIIFDENREGILKKYENLIKELLNREEAALEEC